MGGKNSGGLKKSSLQGIRTSSKIVTETMANAIELFTFPDYGDFTTKIANIDVAIKNNKIDDLPKEIKDDLEDYKVIIDIMHTHNKQHIFFLLWAATEGQELIETKRNGEPILDENGKTIPLYPEIVGENLLNYPGVNTVLPAFEEVNHLITTLPMLKRKYKPYMFHRK